MEMCHRRNPAREVLPSSSKGGEGRKEVRRHRNPTREV
ncbi:hypothetical protein Pint_33688 [Pistacia integerrima]|uniref:Uncharacterized protein n=1 Tax=Pistacia integerrima TaxID=434235 RepID=A0ACC0X5J7_9ROSI|nr:hypothetical protein Pint_33688 [Pistacia integerrima]